MLDFGPIFDFVMFMMKILDGLLMIMVQLMLLNGYIGP